MTAIPAAAPRPTPPLRVLLGHVLRRHRLAQRRTLADVARDARVSTQYLSELERGRKEASSEVLAALCRALRLDLTDLLAELRDDVLVLRSATSVRGSRAVGIASRQAHPVGRPVGDQPVLRAA
jgi:transcriptional regulator with XRE-family HTH domain